MTERSIGQINQKIDDGGANIYTAEEFKKLIKEGNAPSFDEVDVVTTGTCGVMSGTAAILNFIISEPGEFIRANEVYLKGVPAFAGPCPNEWLGSVDVILHGTSHSIYDENYVLLEFDVNVSQEDKEYLRLGETLVSEEELREEDGTIEAAVDEKYSLMDAAKLVAANKYYIMICATYILQQLYSAMLGVGTFYMKYLSVFFISMVPLIELRCGHCPWGTGRSEPQQYRCRPGGSGR